LITPNKLADRYVELWNEPDAAIRRQLVDELYAPDADYIMYRRDPFHGRPAIADQITYTIDLYRPMGFIFRSMHNATGHHNLVRFNWVMVSAETGEMEMAGQDIVVLDDQDRIRSDYQFHDKIPSSFAYNDGFEEHGVATRPAEPQWR
jgi:hypothetical protein